MNFLWFNLYYTLLYSMLFCVNRKTVKVKKNHDECELKQYELSRSLFRNIFTQVNLLS